MYLRKTVDIFVERYNPKLINDSMQSILMSSIQIGNDEEGNHDHDNDEIWYHYRFR